MLLKIKRRRSYTSVIRVLLPGYLAATLLQLANLLGLFEPAWKETFSNGLNMAMIGMNFVMMAMFASFALGAYLALRRPKWSLRVTIRGKGWKCYIENLGREDIEVISKFRNLICVK